MAEVTLVDDVVFSGEGIVHVINRLAEKGLHVNKVIAGIAIGQSCQVLEDCGVELESVRYYSDVHDEVCERDFFAGVPMSGRTVIASDGLWWSAPYFSPLGDAANWASIPSGSERTFSEQCIDRSIALWNEVGSQSGLQITGEMIPRPIRQSVAHPKTPIVELLRKVKSELSEIAA